MSDQNLLRLIIGGVGLLIVALVYLFGGPKKPKQGERHRKPVGSSPRVEPALGDTELVANDGLEPELRETLDRLSGEIREQRAPAADPQRSHVGARDADGSFDRIVTLHVAAREGSTISGADLLVAAEKIGLEYGDLGIFHRLSPTPGATAPVFSMANMVKPGHFDPLGLPEMTTPGVSLFMTLPGPLSALDAFDMMLPGAERLAELLDAQVLDEERNALGRQTIQHLRDELRGYDREREKQTIRKRW
jgi:cell division protein ZipA